MLRLLTFTTLYPNAAQPVHGIMVENRLRHLLATNEVAARVIAPVPWFPSGSPRWGDYAAFARAPRTETRGTVSVDHPRFPVIPKIGAALAPLLLATATYPAVAREASGCDVIDAHYLYPDGVAAVLIAKRLRKPVVITARGSDVNVLPQSAAPRQWIRWAARNADAVITVSSALRDSLIALDIGQPRIEVLRNGVDLEQFAPLSRAQARERLRWGNGAMILSVGKLVEAKGHDLAIRSLAGLPDARLVIVGEGPFHAELQRLAAELGVADRVTLVGAVPHTELRTYYCAADVGRDHRRAASKAFEHNVGHALAGGCQYRHVGGIGEILPPQAGVLLTERTPGALRAALAGVLEGGPSRDAVRRHAETLSWGPILRSQIDLYREVALRGSRWAMKRQRT
jgi:teichuronic acid biosynthesis glycosyltransferase TuaC